MKIKFFLFLASIFLSPHVLATSQWTSGANQTGHKLVMIGGIEMGVIHTCAAVNCPDRGYLMNSGELQLALPQLDELISPANRFEFEWSGDPTSHAEGGTNLKKKFQDWFFDDVCPGKSACEVSFIAHSWGSIIASDFIASLSESTNVKVRTIVTYASPVTGAQIAYWSDPFWEIAVTKVISKNGRWINVINTKDLFAWKIPGTTNLKPDGTPSEKGRLAETFPVSNSEVDFAYLGTSYVRQCPRVFDLRSCFIGAANFSAAWVASEGGIPPAPSDWNAFVADTHLTKNYDANRLVAHIACHSFSQKCDKSAPATVVLPYNNQLENFYGSYPGYFGTRSGGYQSCSIVVGTCQSFSNGKKIAVDTSGRPIKWFDGLKWFTWKS